jgi:hypothetical protein
MENSVGMENIITGGKCSATGGAARQKKSRKARSYWWRV